MSLTDKIKEFKEEAKKFAADGKKALYQGVGYVEHAVDNAKDKIKKREGVLGSIANVVEEGVDAAKNLHHKVQGKGGYAATAKQAANNVSDKIDSLYKKFESAISTDGKYDPEKAKELLKNGAEATKVFGKNAVDGLAKIVKESAEKVGDSYREQVPSKEERETKYAGIGTAKDWLLFRNDFEKCLKFYDEVRVKLPKNLKYRDEILGDIKAYAINNADDIILIYSAKKVPHSWEKRERLNKYFVAPK